MKNTLYAMLGLTIVGCASTAAPVTNSPVAVSSASATVPVTSATPVSSAKPVVSATPVSSAKPVPVVSVKVNSTKTKH